MSKFQSFRAFMAQAGRLALPYFQSDQKWKARGLLAAIIALNLAGVYMLVQINDWNRVFYDALQNKDQPVFWQQLGRFTYLAFAFIILLGILAVCALAYANRVTLLAKVLGQSETRINRQLKRKPR